jgi:hypothetical protein
MTNKQLMNSIGTSPPDYFIFASSTAIALGARISWASPANYWKLSVQKRPSASGLDVHFPVGVAITVARVHVFLSCGMGRRYHRRTHQGDATSRITRHSQGSVIARQQHVARRSLWSTGNHPMRAACRKAIRMFCLASPVTAGFTTSWGLLSKWRTIFLMLSLAPKDRGERPLW